MVITNSELNTSRCPVFLLGSSKDCARENGFADWFNRIERNERTTVVESASEAFGGIFISFQPVRSPRDLYEELKGKAQRWLCVDDALDVSKACALCKQSGVERVFHKRLVDEMRNRVPPAAILYLENHGVWLPDILDLGFGNRIDSVADGEQPRPECVLFACDYGYMEKRKLSAFFSLVTEALGAIGWRTVQVDIHEDLTGWREASPSHVVIVADDLRSSLVAAGLATRRGASIAAWTDPGVSLLEYGFRGIRIPKSLGIMDGKLRTFFSKLLDFLESNRDSDFMAQRNPKSEEFRVDAFLGARSAFQASRIRGYSVLL